MYKQPITVFGGTFDPVHQGHLQIALMLQKEFLLPEIRFIPCKIPVLKEEAHAAAHDRLAMLELAISAYPGLTIDTRELDRTTPSYTVETLHSLRTQFPQHPLCFVLGMDAFLELPQWYHWQELLTLSHLIVINRNAHPIPQDSLLIQLLQRHSMTDPNFLHTTLAGSILQKTITPICISSSNIRQQIRSGQDVSSLLPPQVFHYIQERKLYAK